MCQILAMNSRYPSLLNFSLEGFKYRAGITDEHVDGCGVAFYSNQEWQIYKDTRSASNSLLIDHVKTSNIKSTVAIAHIRKATRGSVSLLNCHPFKLKLWNKEWVFAHNGDLRNFSPFLTGSYLPHGQTDSEIAFCYIMQRLANEFGVECEIKSRTNQNIFKFLTNLCRLISTYGTFNVSLSNGEFLFTHCSTNLSFIERKHPFSKATLIDPNVTIDLSEHNKDSDVSVIVATKPLTGDESWSVCDKGDCHLFKDGSLLLVNKLSGKAYQADTPYYDLSNISTGIYEILLERYVAMSIGSEYADKINSMMRCVVENCTVWPADKIGRWVGYVQAILIEVIKATTIDA